MKRGPNFSTPSLAVVEAPVGNNVAAIVDRILDSSDARDAWYQSTIDRLMDQNEKLIAKLSN